MSWCERLRALQRSEREAKESQRLADDALSEENEEPLYDEPIAVFFGGPPGLGKRRLLRVLAKDSRCTVSRVNFQTLSVAYCGNNEAVLRHLLGKRTGNMIYEHTGLCLTYAHRAVRSEIERVGEERAPDTMLEAYGFYEYCRDTQRRESRSYALWREHRMFLALDLRASHFRRNSQSAYLYAIAYLAAMAEHQLYPRACMLVVMDESDRDRRAADLGIYELVRSLALRTCQVSICHDYAAVMRRLCSMHRPLSIH